MKEKKKDNKKVQLVIIIGIIVVLILILLGISRCSKDEELSGEKNEVSSEKTDKEYELPENPSIGETVTGEEIQDENEVTVVGSDENMDDYTVGITSEDKLEEEDSSEKSNTSSNRTDSSNKNPGNAGNGNTDEDDKEEEGQPSEQPGQPTEEEDLGQSGNEETEVSNKYEDFY